VGPKETFPKKKMCPREMRLGKKCSEKKVAPGREWGRGEDNP
jgi:hypothetical protein